MSTIPSLTFTYFKGNRPESDYYEKAADFCLSLARKAHGETCLVTSATSGKYFTLEQKVNAIARFFFGVMAYTLFLPVTLIGLVLVKYSISQAAIHKECAANLTLIFFQEILNESKWSIDSSKKIALCWHNIVKFKIGDDVLNNTCTIKTLEQADAVINLIETIYRKKGEYPLLYAQAKQVANTKVLQLHSSKVN